MRLRGNGLLDGFLVYRFGGWFEAGSASCPTARSRRFGGGFDSRRARRLARRLARGASAEDSIRDGPGVLPDGSLVALRRRMRFETGLASCPTARLRRFGGGCDSRRARRLARRLAHGASAEDAIRDGPGILPDGSRDNCFTGKIRKGIRSHTRPSWVRAGARSYSSWSV